jgi:integrase/recombinase XerD
VSEIWLSHEHVVLVIFFKPHKRISDDDLVTILKTVDKMPGWHGSMMRDIIALYLSSGLRPRELRLAQLKDLNLKKKTIFVRHPKEENSWASTQEVTLVMDELFPLIERYVKERDEYLRAIGLPKCTALFPNVLKGEDGFYSEKTFNQIKTKVENLSGIHFRLKDFRPTLASRVESHDPNVLPSMSAQLRHSSTKTT